MRLFGNRQSPFVDKVACALELKGVRFETVPVRSPADLKKWNPQTGKMPVLELDPSAPGAAGERCWDSTVILRRIEQLHPEPPLLAGDPAVAAAQRQLEDWADEALYWYVMAYRWHPVRAANSLRELLADASAVLRLVVGPLLARRIGAATRAQGLGRLPPELLQRELEGRLDDLETLLGEDRWLVGAERPSVADLAVVTELRFLSISPDGRRIVAGRPGLVALEQRLTEACRSAG